MPGFTSDMGARRRAGGAKTWPGRPCLGAAPASTANWRNMELNWYRFRNAIDPMAELLDWAFPADWQPTAGELRFDLEPVLDAVVLLRSEIPEDAFTASILGTERTGSAVVIRDDGLMLTIGYLITEAQSIWLTANDGTVLAGHPLAYDAVTGFGLVQPLGRLGAPALARGAAAAAKVGDGAIVIAHGGRAQGPHHRQARVRRLLGVRARRGAVHLAPASGVGRGGARRRQWQAARHRVAAGAGGAGWGAGAGQYVRADRSA